MVGQGVVPMVQHDVFISYSQQADARVAEHLERGLKRLGRRWNQRRALSVFRDASSLSASPDLWVALARQLEDARYAVVLLSPEAAQSKWVNREIDHFLGSHDDDRLLLGLTSGQLEWDDTESDWTADSTAVPDCLRLRYVDAPLWVDLRWARDAGAISLNDHRFRSAVAALAAPVHGLTKDELEGEDLRQYRRFKRIRRVAVGALVLLLAAAATTSLLALLFRGQTATERALRMEVEDVNAELDQANSDLTQLNGELDLANTELEKTNEELDDANAELENTNDELDTANTELEQTNDELDQANEDLETTNAALEESNAALDQANLELTETNAALEESNAALDQANLELEAANERLAALEAFAARSAGQAICAISSAEWEAIAAHEQRLQHETIQFRFRDNFRATVMPLLEDPDLTVEALAAAVLTYNVELDDWGVVITPPFAGPRPCSEIGGFPFRDRWSTIGNVMVPNGELLDAPDPAT